MFRLANSFWVLAYKCLFCLFGFILRYIFRFKEDDNSLKNDYNCIVDHSQPEDQTVSGSSMFLETDGSAKTENSDGFFEFRFQNYYTRNGETEVSVFQETSPIPNTSKYEVFSGKDISGFMEEPETMRFTIQEMFLDAPIVNKPKQDALFSPVKKSQELHVEKDQEILVGSNDCFIGKDQMIRSVSADEDFQELNSEVEATILQKTEDSIEKFDQNQLDKSHFSPLESEPESSSSSEGVSIINHKVDSVDNEFCSDTRVDEGLKQLEFIKKKSNSKQISIDESSLFDRKAVTIRRDESEDSDDEYIDFEPILQFSSHLGNSLYTTELERVETKQRNENLQSPETEKIDKLGKSKEQNSQKMSLDSDFEDEDDSDILLKYRDLVEQMKSEIKNGRTKGLPTILEESETLKMDDLKPLKIDAKLEHKDRVEEIQKVYKSYAEKMRKLDVLNYQTMHAISFLQLKDPIQQANSGQKSSVMTSFLFQNLWPSKLRRIYADPTLKSICELHRDLELVYIGQVCLSWEILHWQYGKAREFWENDFEVHGPYNQVAGEFQQFQVLVQRFVENEPYQGRPRVQNYTKDRYELRAFLQVPVVKDNCSKDKNDGRVEEENAVSIAMMTEIIDESMRAFWEFVRADKDEANTSLKGLQDPSCFELLMDVKTSLQKKERRLKEILRSGNCIVKKFQKDQECRMDRSSLFAQVELKLVSRVLNMSRLTTDQLVWCQNKLNRISFINKKIHVEPSFLLFPF
ncbi:uncharacterized protein LOC114288178 [Camellia sinensis]|uniref:uncharacterized protein LOC114288178 n=1 Tax=Camellia sinensis TaxID=4442 RepID=UPI00103638A9|nr:uncharacterized protein LOC114288178 [Camellia sinensis]